MGGGPGRRDSHRHRALRRANFTCGRVLSISMARRKLLAEDEIVARLAEVPRWMRKGSAIARTWEFEDFPPALVFINRVGALAEEANHHPDIANSWNRVTLTLTTHDRGGLTGLDFALAKRIDALEPHGGD